MSYPPPPYGYGHAGYNSGVAAFNPSVQQLPPGQQWAYDAPQQPPHVAAYGSHPYAALHVPLGDAAFSPPHGATPSHAVHMSPTQLVSSSSAAAGNGHAQSYSAGGRADERPSPPPANGAEAAVRISQQPQKRSSLTSVPSVAEKDRVTDDMRRVRAAVYAEALRQRLLRQQAPLPSAARILLEADGIERSSSSGNGGAVLTVVSLDASDPAATDKRGTAAAASSAVESNNGNNSSVGADLFDGVRLERYRVMYRLCDRAATVGARAFGSGVVYYFELLRFLGLVTLALAALAVGCWARYIHRRLESDEGPRPFELISGGSTANDNNNNNNNATTRGTSLEGALIADFMITGYGPDDRTLWYGVTVVAVVLTFAASPMYLGLMRLCGAGEEGDERAVAKQEEMEEKKSGGRNGKLQRGATIRDRSLSPNRVRSVPAEGGGLGTEDSTAAPTHHVVRASERRRHECIGTKGSASTRRAGPRARGGGGGAAAAVGTHRARALPPSTSSQSPPSVSSSAVAPAAEAEAPPPLHSQQRIVRFDNRTCDVDVSCYYRSGAALATRRVLAIVFLLLILGVQVTIAYFLTANQEKASFGLSMAISVSSSAIAAAFKFAAPRVTEFMLLANFDWWKRWHTLSIFGIRVGSQFAVFAAKDYGASADTGCSYDLIGEQLVTSLLVEVIVAPITEVAFALLWRANARRIAAMLESRLGDEDNLYAWDLADYYRNVLFRYFIAAMAMAIVPLAAALAAVGFAVQYWVDKFLLFKVCGRPQRVAGSQRHFVAGLMALAALCALVCPYAGSVFVLSGRTRDLSPHCTFP